MENAVVKNNDKVEKFVNNIRKIKGPWGMSVYEKILVEVMNLIITFEMFLVYSPSDTTQRTKLFFPTKSHQCLILAENSLFNKREVR